MKIRRKNPFRVFFFAVAVICCIVLSIVFYYISYTNNKKTQEQYVQEKIELIMGDFEKQLEMMEDISQRIASNYEFYPYYFKKSIARELSMLETFKQYQYYTTLTDEYFLYYGENYIYRSMGSTLDLELFMQTKSENEEEWQWFRETLTELREELTEIRGDLKVLAIFDEIYVLIPLRLSGGGQQNTAVLGFVVETDNLKERFGMVSGGIEGEITLYGEDGILYSNQAEPCGAEQKNVQTAVSSDGRYRFCYCPQMEYSTQSSIFFLLILLFVIEVFLVVVIANIFAERAYKPIQVMTEKFRGGGGRPL